MSNLTCGHYFLQKVIQKLLIQKIFLRIYLIPGTLLGTGDASWLKDSLCPHGGYIIAERDTDKCMNKKIHCIWEGSKCHGEK